MAITTECYADTVMYDISAANFEKVFKIVGFPFPVTTMDYWSVTYSRHFRNILKILFNELVLCMYKGLGEWEGSYLWIV